MYEQDRKLGLRSMRTIPVWKMPRRRLMCAAQGEQAEWEDGEESPKRVAVEVETLIAEVCCCAHIYQPNNLKMRNVSQSASVGATVLYQLTIYQMNGLCIISTLSMVNLKHFALPLPGS